MRPLKGLGSPPAPYYTNDVESKKYILKQHLHCKKSQLLEFVDNMKALIAQQHREVEKAVAIYGEYHLLSLFKLGTDGFVNPQCINLVVISAMFITVH